MTDIEKYQSALASVNDITDRADSFVNQPRHLFVKVFTDARDKIGSSYDIAVAAAQSDDENRASLGTAAVAACANAMAQLAIECRNALLDANGGLKPVAESTFDDYAKSSGDKISSIASGAVSAVEGLGSTLTYVAYAAIAVAVIVGGFYAYSLYRRAKP